MDNEKINISSMLNVEQSAMADENENVNLYRSDVNLKSKEAQENKRESKFIPTLEGLKGQIIYYESKYHLVIDVCHDSDSIQVLTLK